jgi:hypothetical protein
MLAFEFIAGGAFLLQFTGVLSVSRKRLAHTPQYENDEKNWAHQN